MSRDSDMSTAPAVDAEGLVRTLPAAVARLTAEMRAVRDPRAVAIGIWTVEDLAKHLVAIFEMYARYLRRDAPLRESVTAITEYNQQLMDAEPERSIPVLADRVDAATADFVETAHSLGETRVPWHGGVEVTRTDLAGIALAEALLHGYDIASSQRRPWRIDPEEAALAWDGLTGVMPHFVVPEAAAKTTAFEIRLRNRPPLFLLFGGGELRVSSEHQGRVDCHVAADPAAFLMVGYGRTNRVAAALTGKIFAWGRRPWLALKLPSMLRVP